MAGRRNDVSIQDYAVAVPVINGTVALPAIPLLGNNHLSVTCVNSAGVVATAQLQFTDFDQISNGTNLAIQQGNTWWNVGTATTLTASGANGITASNVGSKWMRVQIIGTATAGTVSLAITLRANAQD